VNNLLIIPYFKFGEKSQKSGDIEEKEGKGKKFLIKKLGEK
jgi:hypothetical protein